MLEPFPKLQALLDEKHQKVQDASKTLDEYKRKSEQGGIFQPLMYVYWGLYRWLKFYEVYDKAYKEWLPVAEAMFEATDILRTAHKDVIRVCQIVEDFKDKMLI